MNCTPEFGLRNEGPSSGGAVCFEEARFGKAREGCETDRAGVRQGLAGIRPCHLGGHCRKMDPCVQGYRQGGFPGHGIQAQAIRLRDEAGRGTRLRRQGDDQAGGHVKVWHSQPDPAQAVGEGVPRGRARGAEAETQGEAQETRRRTFRPGHPRRGAGGGKPQAQGRGGVPKKLHALEAAKRAPGRNAR